MSLLSQFLRFGFLSAPWAERLGWTLLHSLWQITTVALVYALLSVLLRKKSARVRYVLACAALLAMMALMVGTYLSLPAGSAPLTPDLGSAAGEAGTSEIVSPAMSLPATVRRLDVSSVEGPVSLAPEVSPVVIVEPTSIVLLSVDALRPWMPWLSIVWLLGVCACSLRPVCGWIHVRRLQRCGLSSLPDSLQRLAQRTADRLGVTRLVQFMQSALVEVPTVVGFLRPLVLLPASVISGMAAADIELILAHELAHIRRHDYLVNLAQTVIETLLFYHPAMWWLSVQVRRERENCCDDIAVAAGASKTQYVHALTRLEAQRAATSVAALAATGGSLLGRVRRLLGCPCTEFGYRSVAAWLTGLVAIGFVSLALAIGAAPREREQEVDDELIEEVAEAEADANDDERASNREAMLDFARAMAAGDSDALKQTWEFQDDLDERFGRQLAEMFARAEEMSVELVSMRPLGDERLFACFLMRDAPEVVGRSPQPQFVTFRLKEGIWRCPPMGGGLRMIVDARAMGVERLGRRAITQNMMSLRFGMTKRSDRSAVLKAQADAFARLARPPYHLTQFERLAEILQASVEVQEAVSELSWQELWRQSLEEGGAQMLPQAGDFSLGLYLEAAEDDDLARELPLPEGQETIRVEPFPVLTDAMVLRADVTAVAQMLASSINVTLSEGGAKIFEAVTRNSIGKRIAIMVDGKVISAPVVRDKISGGKVQITGSFSQQEAEAIAKKLNAHREMATEFLDSMEMKADFVSVIDSAGSRPHIGVENKWTITKHPGHRLAHGWVSFDELNGEVNIREHVGGGTSTSSITDPLELMFKATEKEDVLHLEISTRSKDGVRKSGSKVTRPKDSEVRFRKPVPFSGLTTDYQILCRCDFIKQGQIIKSVAYVARLSPNSEHYDGFARKEIPGVIAKIQESNVIPGSALWAKPVNGLQCRLLPVEQEVEPSTGDYRDMLVYVTYELRNVSDKETKFLPEYCPLQGVMSGSLFKVVDKDGKVLKYKGISSDPMPPTAASYLTIKPGQKLSKRVGLPYDFSSPGPYRVTTKTAVLQNSFRFYYGNDKNGIANNPDNVWAGELKPNAVTVNVVSATGPWGKPTKQGLALRLGDIQEGPAGVLQADLGNKGYIPWKALASRKLFELEVDGKRYVNAGEIVPPDTQLEPGQIMSDITIPLDGAWLSEQKPFTPLEFGELAPGTHSIRIGFIAEPVDRKHAKPTPLMSNSVEIEITPASQ